MSMFDSPIFWFYRGLHSKLDKLNERMNKMSIDFTDLSAKIDNAIAVLGSATADKTALAQAQADLAAAQTEVNSLTAKLKAALPTT